MRPEAAQPFPWDDVLAFALGVLRWPPEVMWAATPREITAAAAALAPHRAPQALDGESLNALMRLYPDSTQPGSGDEKVPGYST